MFNFECMKTNKQVNNLLPTKVQEGLPLFSY